MAGRNKDGITIIGIDPGSLVCGYGIVKTDGKSPDNCRYIASGEIKLRQKMPLHERLNSIHQALLEVITAHSPEEASVEKVFFAKSVSSALSLGQARGAALVAVSSKGLEVFEYSALEVKKSVTGYGKAEKGQVMEMVKAILRIPAEAAEGLSTDASDALALALCHAQAALSYKRAITRQGDPLGR